MKKIYLLSGPGTQEGFSEEIKNYMKKDFNKKKQITFIASSPDNYSKNELFVYGNGENIVGMKNHLKEVVNLEEITILDSRIDSGKGKEIILNSEIVYLLGGNPFNQLEYLRENGYDKILDKYQGLLLGSSCGAMNLAREGYYSKDDDYDKSFFYEGINLVDITIDPHFDINNDDQVEEAIKFSKINKIVGLPNESAIRIEGKEVTYINKCFIFENGILEERMDNEYR